MFCCRHVFSPICRHQSGMMKYILVTGGVISGIGKGIIASSVGTILKSCGLHVTAIKIDPYINIDAGTFSPYEHGEVFVLDDGGEVDLDLGNYERFLDIRLTKDNNLTTGKIYQSVINKERRGTTWARLCREWVVKQAKVPVEDDGVEPEVCVIEAFANDVFLMSSCVCLQLGGTVGDIESMPFIEAFRQFQFKVKRENFCNIHVSLIPQPSTTGEQKTKPTQNTVRELRGLGLSPDLIMCRCATALENSVICVHDVSSIYKVPLLLEQQGVCGFLTRRLNMPMETRPRRMLTKWKEMSDSHKLEVKYIDSANLELSTLQEEPLAVCEFARNTLGWADANSTEFDPDTKHPVVIDMPEHNPGQMGGTMRLGKRRTIFMTNNSVLRKLYGDAEYVDERHRHRFEVNPELKSHFEEKGFRFVGQDVEGERMEVIELDDHPYFVGVQYHPEFTSRPIKPSPPYLGLLLAAAGKLPGYLVKGCRLSPRDTYSDRSGSSSPDSEISELKMPSLSNE
ncbi:hypothetical protein F7725_024796 [Dissostichus mawsoni]|uniref:CTP synthase n=1 Tax=Dissostichus mawsoni TaxID=36200 RepID=A0A7J5X9C4_DISMA|nr:hypothetical protein F7725_024796 [Dissostichus mawsoni]